MVLGVKLSEFALGKSPGIWIGSRPGMGGSGNAEIASSGCLVGPSCTDSPGGFGVIGLFRISVADMR